MNDTELQHALVVADLTNCEKATLILWSEAQRGSMGLTTYGLSKKMTSLRVGNPNRAQLEKDLKKSPDVIRIADRFQIKAGRTEQIKKLLVDTATGPVVDFSTAYIPREIWAGTRNYIEKVATQLCGCWEQQFYDAAAVMLRRLAETLVIEAYEALQREGEIRGTDGHYFMFGRLVDKSCSDDGLRLGREAKSALNEIKTAGDRSAHNRRINAVRPELEHLRGPSRVAIEELLNIARLKG